MEILTILYNRAILVYTPTVHCIGLSSITNKEQNVRMIAYIVTYFPRGLFVVSCPVPFNFRSLLSTP